MKYSDSGPARQARDGRFVKGYNEKFFESEKFPLRVADNGVRGAQINVLELKFSLFAHCTTFFAAKKNLRGVKLFNDHLRQHRIRQKTFRIDGLRGAVCENRAKCSGALGSARAPSAHSRCSRAPSHLARFSHTAPPVARPAEFRQPTADNVLHNEDATRRALFNFIVGNSVIPN